MFSKVLKNSHRIRFLKPEPCKSLRSVRWNSNGSKSATNDVNSNKLSTFLGVAVTFGVVGGIVIEKLKAVPTLNEVAATPSKNASTSPLDVVTPVEYADATAFASALDEIREAVGKDKVATDRSITDGHADSDFNTHHPPNREVQRPDAIVSPESTEDVSKILKIAHKYRVPVVASSGLTSLEGQYIHTKGPNSISLSFGNMDKVLAVHPDDLDIVVQPGVGWQDLDEFLTSDESTAHLLFGPDPGPGAAIGGMVGTSCSGTNAYRYGTMKENVINLTIVLADGTIVKTKQRPRKSSAGYDLTRLFIGSEGTLGVVTEATLKLNVRPQKEYVSVASFPTIKDAATTARELISKSGIHLNAIEILDKTTVSFVNASSEEGAKKFEEAPSLFLKAGGATESAIQGQIEIVEKLSKENNVISIETSKDETNNAVLWEARKSGLWSTVEYGRKVLEDPNDVQIWTTDIAVPISRLDTVIAETNDDLNNSGFKDRFSVMGHIGDGNCHFLVVYNSKDYANVQEIVDRMVHRAISHEGTCTGEHGVGVGKRRYLESELGGTSVDLMRHLKLLLDPRRILNPDKIFRLDSTDNLDELLSGGHVKEVNKPCNH